MDMEERYEQVKWNYEQLRNIVRPESMTSFDWKNSLAGLEKIIQRELPELLKKAAPPNIYELTSDFRGEYEKFKDFIVYKPLIGKNVIGLGGGFSSGKSSFLNALMGGEEILPQAIKPSTSVPTYLVHGEENVVKAINIFDACVELELGAINEISHGFGAVGEEGEQETEPVQLGHVLKNMFLETPLQPYENLVFLDTPGYSKPGSENYSAKTDETIARQQLNTANYILWFMTADGAGSFTASDMDFLHSLNPEIPIMVICTKANRRTLAQRQAIAAKLKEQILLENLPVQDIFFFETEDAEGYDRSSINELFTRLNQQPYEEKVFAKHFKRLFWECRAYYKKQAEAASLELRNLQNALLLMEDSGGVAAYIERVKANSEQERDAMKQAGEEMIRLQTVFFKEIKAVGDRVGIYMPEPRDIDVLGDKITDPLAILMQYNRDHHKQVPPELKERLLDGLRDIQPEFEKEPGGSGYQKTVQEILATTDFPSQEEIKFGNDLNYHEMMQAALQGTNRKNKKLK
jgi:GTP-binding protein EngB required for normal cell division